MQKCALMKIMGFRNCETYGKSSALARVLTERSAADHHAVHQGDHHAEFTHSPVESNPEESRLQWVDEDQRNVLLQ